jgi:hypothetical protein
MAPDPRSALQGAGHGIDASWPISDAQRAHAAATRAHAEARAPIAGARPRPAALPLSTFSRTAAAPAPGGLNASVARATTLVWRTSAAGVAGPAVVAPPHRSAVLRDTGPTPAAPQPATPSSSVRTGDAAASAPSTNAPAAAPDLDDLAERVLRRLSRHLVVERERKGALPCL